MSTDNSLRSNPFLRLGHWPHLALSLLIGLACASTAVANAPVFKVSKGTAHILIGGTLHLMTEDDYPLPQKFEQAFQAADELVFETDLVAANSMPVVVKMINALSYKDGSSLADHVSPATFDAISDYLLSRNTPIAAIDEMQPRSVIDMLTYIELQHLGLDGEGVDEFFSARATLDNKPQRGLETVDEQIAFLQSIHYKDPDAVLMKTLEDIKNLTTYMDNIKADWRTGLADDGFLVEALGEMAVVMPNAYRILIRQRNVDWLDKLEAMFQDSDTELVLVGAAHLVGKQNVLSSMQARGYTVTRY